MSMHNRNELSDEQAKHKFYNAHAQEVQHLLKEKMIADSKQNEGNLITKIN